MASFLRYRPVLSGWVGGPGINTWHGSGDVVPILPAQAQQFADEIRVVYETIKALFVNGVTINFPGEVTEHDESTGQLLTVHGVTSPAQVLSTGSIGTSNVTRDMQLLVRLNTSSTRDGKRLNGHHFIGPAHNNTVDASGQVGSGTRTTLAAAYGGVLDLVGPNLYVWGPPKHDANGNVISGGKLGRVTAVSVSPVPGTLRSRKN